MIKVYNEGVKNKYLRGDLEFICKHIASMDILKDANTIDECLGVPRVKINPNTNTHVRDYLNIYSDSKKKVDFSDPASIYNNVCLLVDKASNRLNGTDSSVLHDLDNFVLYDDSLRNESENHIERFYINFTIPIKSRNETLELSCRYNVKLSDRTYNKYVSNEEEKDKDLVGAT